MRARASPHTVSRPRPHTPTPSYFFAIALGLLFLLWLRLHQPPNTVDDAYITFRYARNLATGAGFVYNPGERVLGTTTPAYAMLLALLSGLTRFFDYPRLALMTNALLDALTFCLVLRLVARLTRWRWVALGAALLFAVEGRTLDFSTGGMEASFNVLAVVLTLLLFLEGRTRWAALALGLAVLIRPDGLTLAAPIFAALVFEGVGADGLASRVVGAHGRAPLPDTVRRLPWVEAGLFALVVVPWLVFATLYFGNPIPQSILAKSELYRTPELMAFRAFLVQLRTVFPFSLPPLHDPEPLNRQLLQAVLPAALAGLGLVRAQQLNRRAWVIGAYIALFIAFYSVGNPLWLGWYEIPLMPLYQALILTGLVWLAERAAAALRPARAARPVAVHALALAAVGVMTLPHLSRLNALPWETRERPPLVLNPAFNKRREEDYELLARMLQPAAEAGRLVAIPEIGAFGYVYPGPLFDTSGLISPPVLKYFPIPADIPVEIYSIPRQMIFDLRPDLFISFDSFMQATLPPDDPEFLRLYVPTIGMTSHAAFGVQRLMTYRRADLPAEAALPPEAAPAGVHFADGLVSLAGYDSRFWADQQDRFVELTLFWHAGQAPPNRELLARVNLLDATGRQVYQVIDYPGEQLFPTASWTAGMWLVDRYQLKRPLPDTGPYTAQVTLFATDADLPLPAVDAQGARLPDDTVVIDGITMPEAR